VPPLLWHEGRGTRWNLVVAAKAHLLPTSVSAQMAVLAKEVLTCFCEYWKFRKAKLISEINFKGIFPPSFFFLL
jgi:hypothetical protein